MRIWFSKIFSLGEYANDRMQVRMDIEKNAWDTIGYNKLWNS